MKNKKAFHLVDYQTSLFLQHQLSGYGAFLRCLEQRVQAAINPSFAGFQYFSKVPSLDENGLMAQKSFLAQFEVWSKQNDCFMRRHEVGHFTASSWVVDLATLQVLLIFHRKLNKWLQPGGHCDGNSRTLEVAVKELEEETGVTSECFVQQVNCGFVTLESGMIFDLDIHVIPEYQNQPEHLHWDVRHLFWVDSREIAFTPKKNFESLDIGFFSLATLEQQSQEASLLRMRDKVLHLLG